MLIMYMSVLLYLQGKFALCASTHRFLTVTSDSKIMAISEKAKEKEIMTVSKIGHQCIRDPCSYLFVPVAEDRHAADKEIQDSV